MLHIAGDRWGVGVGLQGRVIQAAGAYLHEGGDDGTGTGVTRFTGPTGATARFMSVRKVEDATPRGNEERAVAQRICDGK